MPVLLTAIAAAVMFSLPSIFGADVMPCGNCCASVFAATLGIMPVLMYRRIGGNVTPGLGCLIAVLGVGIGGIAGAIVQAKFPGYDASEVRDLLNQTYDQLESQGQTPPMPRDEFLRFFMGIMPYMVIVIAAVTSFAAGVFGLLAASLGRRQQPPPQSPPNWPQQPPPNWPQPPQV
jgi:uncharacterized protein (DUF697 family)